MLLTIKQLSEWLNIKPSTLYLWAAQGKIPCRKIHGLLRFERDAIQDWLQSFEATYSKAAPSFSCSPSHDLDALVEAAKRGAYTPRHGETISPSPSGKEDENGAR
jgi:excisionase family DNA binding protein